MAASFICFCLQKKWREIKFKLEHRYFILFPIFPKALLWIDYLEYLIINSENCDARITLNFFIYS